MDNDVVIIKIDRGSIRSNPNAGRTDSIFPGKTHTDVDANGNVSQYRELQKVHHNPEAAYFFSYVDTDVKCKHCEEVFSHTKLEDECYDDVGVIVRICPKCGMGECCHIEFEDINSAVK